MEAIHLNFDFDSKPKKPLEFIPFGDMHVGTAGCAEGHIKKYVDHMRRKKMFWWGMGDFIDGICYTDPRFDPEEAPDWMKVKDLKDLPKVQADRFLDLVAPIANRCLFIIHGNHEEMVAKHTHQDIGNYIATSLGVPHLGYSGIINFRFRWVSPTGGNPKSTTRKVFAHHGWGGGRTHGGKANKVIKYLEGYNCTDFFMGHVHDVLISKTSRLGSRDKKTMSGEWEIKPGMRVTWGNDELRSQELCFGLTGSFLKEALYAEVKGYNPSFVGAIKWTVDPFYWVGGKEGGWVARPDVGTLTL